MYRTITSKNASSAGNQQERPLEINPWYISGFADGEGTFHVSFTRRVDLPKKWAIIPEFHISQNYVRSTVLNEIQNFFGCGRIKENHRSNSKDLTYVFVVRSRKELIDKIIPFFRKYPLRTSKQNDFLIFAEIVKLMEEGRHLTEEGFREITRKAFSMNDAGRYRQRKITDILKESSETVRQSS